MAKRRKRAAKAKSPGFSSTSRGACAYPAGSKSRWCTKSDPDGRPVTHGRTVDTLARMRRVGTVTPAMHDAARDFQAHFIIAAYDASPGSSIVRIARIRNRKGAWSDDLTVRQVAARERVHEALAALGGMASPGGSCVWHVAGLGHSLREWAVQQGWNASFLSACRAS